MAVALPSHHLLHHLIPSLQLPSLLFSLSIGTLHCHSLYVGHLHHPRKIWWGWALIEEQVVPVLWLVQHGGSKRTDMCLCSHKLCSHGTPLMSPSWRLAFHWAQLIGLVVFFFHFQPTAPPHFPHSFSPSLSLSLSSSLSLSFRERVSV